MNRTLLQIIKTITLPVVLAAAAATGTFTMAAAGDLDTTFGSGGAYNDTVPTQSCFGLSPAASAVQSDGKIIVVGKIFDKCNYTYSTDPASTRRLYVRRYKSNGSPDSGSWWTAAFGIDGFGVADTGSGISLLGEASSVLIQSDGKIVVGGRRWSLFNGYTAYVWRFNTNGELDTGFGTNGTVYWSSSLNPANASALSISQNKLLVGVSTNNNSNIRLGRLYSNGTVDANFGTFAQIITNIVPEYGRFGLEGSTDLGGVIYVAGKLPPGQGGAAVVARFYPNGNLDTTFGTAGRATYTTCLPNGANVATQIDSFSKVAVQSNGKILAYGDGQLVGLSVIGSVARFSTSGVLDTSFGSTYEYPCGVVHSPSNSSFRKQTNDTFLTFYNRYSTDGILDQTFGVPAGLHGWTVATSFDPANGKIVFANRSDYPYDSVWLYRVLP